jgi:site-specific recombinase XerD
MNKFKDLYEFIDLAKHNRKYPANTANNLKSSLKIFEKELNIDELNSVDLIEDNIEEIFINAVTKNKNKNIGSLNTYKARLLKVIKDYQKYGVDPSKMQSWNTKQKKTVRALNTVKDNTDKLSDKPILHLSDHINTPVNNIHKIELALRHNEKFVLILPKDISAAEAKTIKSIIDSLII